MTNFADSKPIIIIVSAHSEWRATLALYNSLTLQSSPVGTWFETMIPVHGLPHRVIFFHGGWGKIPAAASTQYVIDRWNPILLVNLATCGGFEGEIESDEVILAERTVVYDIIEQMGDPESAINHFSTQLDLSWLQEPYPHPVRRTVLVSADRDILVEDVPMLKEKYGAIAGDWESGAIAYVAKRNNLRCLILRGVTDIAGKNGDKTYGALELFQQAANRVMSNLIHSLPEWLDKIQDL